MNLLDDWRPPQKIDHLKGCVLKNHVQEGGDQMAALKCYRCGRRIEAATLSDCYTHAHQTGWRIETEDNPVDVAAEDLCPRCYAEVCCLRGRIVD